MSDEHIQEAFPKVAVIGMSGRFPGAQNITRYWENICNGIESVTTFSDDEIIQSGIDKNLLHNPDYIKAGAIIEGSDQFDASFFGYSPREAQFMDPQHRLFLECAYNSMEDAGYNPFDFNGTIGIFAGNGMNNYLINNLIKSEYFNKVGSYQAMLGNDKDFLSTRVAYKLNLKGPAINIQTACSTSLVAVQFAYQSLINYQCDLTIAGGVSLRVPQKGGYLYQEGQILSKDGRCRVFDHRSSGTVLGEGVGAVVLKRYEDAVEDQDDIYAVICGAAINNDGFAKAGFTTPGIEGQKEVVLMAQSMADITADRISYIETHGTGTAIGDPIEFHALTGAFGESTDKTGYCALGAVKANIGHLDSAAGIAGFIKTCLVVKNKKIPPLINYEEANPEINLAQSPFYIPQEIRDYKGREKFYAGVSSFGMGGTNAHIVLEEPPVFPDSCTGDNYHLLLFSARSENSLKNNLVTYKELIKSQSCNKMCRIAYTLQVGRKHFNKRTFIVGSEKETIIQVMNKQINKLERFHADLSKAPVCFLFPGQGSQYFNMGQQIYHRFNYFKELFDECTAIYQELSGVDLRNIIFKTEQSEEDENIMVYTEVAQPAVFIFEYCLAKLLIHAGITPSAMLGHSIGEYVAACLAGVFSLEDALFIIYHRAKLIGPMEKGAMLSIPLPADEVKKILTPLLSLAAVNAPNLCVVSGRLEDIKIFNEKLEGKGITGKILKTSHAFHSHLLDPILDDFTNIFSQVTINPIEIPFISNVTGDWMTDEKASSPQYWVDHLRKTIEFSNGLSRLLNEQNSIYVEVGPGQVLSSILQLHYDENKLDSIINTTGHPKLKQDEVKIFFEALGKLWLHKVNINWENLTEGSQCRRTHIPGYQFNKSRFWIDNNKIIHIDKNDEYNMLSAQRNAPLDFATLNKESIGEIVTSIWQDILGIEHIDPDDNFFDLGGHSLLASQVIKEINQRLQVEFSLRNLFIEPTIRGMIKLVQIELDQKLKTTSSPDTEKTFPILFPVQPKGKKIPLFLVAGAHDARYYDLKTMKSNYEEDFFRYLSNILPHLGNDQPVHSFRPRGLMMHEKPHRSVVEMATDYVTALKKLQPEGPYLIGGECAGGIVAYEMARQLKAAGDEPLNLILMDTNRPTFPFYIRETLIYYRRWLKHSFLKYIKAFKSGSIKNILKLCNNDIKEAFIFFFPVTKHLREIRRLQVGSYNYQQTLLKYRTKEYNGKITLIANEEWIARRKNLGWKITDYSRFTLKIIPGDHKTRLTTFGKQTGSFLKETINRSLENT